MVICPICLNMLLTWCIIMLSGYGNTSNIQQHYKSIHGAPVSTEDSRVQYSKDSGDISISMRSTKSMIKQTSIVQYTQDILLTQSDARAEIQEAIYHFVSDCGCPGSYHRETTIPQFIDMCYGQFFLDYNRNLAKVRFLGYVSHQVQLKLCD